MAVTLVVSLIFIPQASSQFLPPFLSPFGAQFFLPPPFPVLPPFPLRTQAIPLANFTPLTVTVPQVTAAGLTITSLVPGLATPLIPTLSVIVNLTGATFPLLPTTFLLPFPLTAAVAPLLPTVATTVAIPPAATPTLTTLIALGLGGGVPGLGGGTTLFNLLPLPVPATALPVVVLPTAVAPTAIPII